MPRVTEQLLRKRSEHNDGLLSTLEEVDLHQEGLTRLGPRLRRACPRLQHLSLPGNALGRLCGPEACGLRSLRTLNLALNCLRRLPPARVMLGLESLERLDLTANFLDASAMFALGDRVGGGGGGGEEEEERENSAHSVGGALGQLPRLTELWLMGNPCVEALRRAGGEEPAPGDAEGGTVDGSGEGGQGGGGGGGGGGEGGVNDAPAPAFAADAYRSYVLLALPGLMRLDGEPATASARLAARRAAGSLARALRRAAAAELGLEEEARGGGGEAASVAAAAAVAALEASVVAGEEHPETLALYGPPGAIDDETSESDDGEDDEDDGAAKSRRRLCRPRVRETGSRDPATGEVRRPWCPVTRLLDLRDQRRQRGGASKGGAAAREKQGGGGGPPAEGDLPLFSGPHAGRRQPRRQALPPLPDQDPGTGETLPLRNEGRWRFSLDAVVASSSSSGPATPSAVVVGGGGAGSLLPPPPLLPPKKAAPRSSASSSSSAPLNYELELDVDVGRYVDTSHMQLEVLPRAVRLLVRGRLLQLRLPGEVRADACAARRSLATGRLCVRMPLLAAGSGTGIDDPTLVHPRSVWGSEEQEEEAAGQGDTQAAVVVAAVPAAVVVQSGGGGGDDGDDSETPPHL